MKTIEAVKKDIKELSASISAMGVFEPGKKNRMLKRLEFMRMCVTFLEHCPDEAFLQRQHDQQCALLKSIDDGWKPNENRYVKEIEEAKNPKKKYETIMGRAHVVKQIENLNYLLS